MSFLQTRIMLNNCEFKIDEKKCNSFCEMNKGGWKGNHKELNKIILHKLKAKKEFKLLRKMDFQATSLFLSGLTVN